MGTLSHQVPTWPPESAFSFSGALSFYRLTLRPPPHPSFLLTYHRRRYVCVCVRIYTHIPTLSASPTRIPYGQEVLSVLLTCSLLCSYSLSDPGPPVNICWMDERMRVNTLLLKTTDVECMLAFFSSIPPIDCWGHVCWSPSQGLSTRMEANNHLRSNPRSAIYQTFDPRQVISPPSNPSFLHPSTCLSAHASSSTHPNFRVSTMIIHSSNKTFIEHLLWVKYHVNILEILK